MCIVIGYIVIWLIFAKIIYMHDRKKFIHVSSGEYLAITSIWPFYLVVLPFIFIGYVFLWFIELGAKD